MKWNSQGLILLMMLAAAWVAFGLAQKKNRWKAILTYWIILTIKNAVDFAAGWW